MVQTPQELMTLEQFLRLPETKPVSEWIQGRIFQKAIPQGKHSRLQSRLVAELNALAESQRKGLALSEIRCSFAGHSLVPDLAVFEWKRIPLDEDGDIANVFSTYPDWTIEILSPGQSESRVTDNILFCLNAGTQMGWLINPAEKQVLVFPAGQQPISIVEAGQILPMPAFMPPMDLTLGELFGCLKPG